LLESFIHGRDGASAFEALVARHGPMVLGVCRRELGDRHDAEDAFQATFLVLLRQAGAIRRRDSLSSWLCGVARRIAARSRTNARLRQQREGSRRAIAAAAPVEADRDEIRVALHDELRRLPEKYRAPIMLCDIEGQTHAEAARMLSWPVGTVSGRLARGRELLRGRVVRRGITLSAAALAASLFSPTATRAWALRGMAILRGKAAALVLATAGAVAGGSGLGGVERSQQPEAAASAVAGSVPAAVSVAPPGTARLVRPRAASTPVAVRALTPDGRTLATGGSDAAVHLWDVPSGRPLATLAGHSAPILALAFSPDGQTLASAATDRTVLFWDVDSGRVVLTLHGVPTSLVELAFG
jgi:RNA polymerase sigma factor (sigma-70 family)